MKYFLSLLFIVAYSLLGEINHSIYVSPKGDDRNDGSINHPYKTIRAAVKTVKSNSTIYVRGGTYNERILLLKNKVNNSLTIKAYKNEKVLFTGLDEVTEWKPYKGEIYYAEMEAEVTQLFVEDKQMVYARWPNLPSNDLLNQRYGLATEIQYKSGERISYLLDSSVQNLQGLDLNGTKISFPYPLAKGWNGFSEEVHSIQGDTLKFSSLNYFSKKETESVISKQSRKIVKTREDEFYELARSINYSLTGKLELLDTANEWFYDAKLKRLYFYTPNGIDPNELNVMARKRLDAITIRRSNVHISDIDFFAASITVKGDSNLIEDCTFSYPRPFYTPERFKHKRGLLFNGAWNTIRRCEVANSWGTGISMIKSEDGSIEDCLIHDVNWSGSMASGIEVDGTRITVKNNTVFRCGRSGIRHYSVYNSLFEKNHIYDYGLINNDLGGIKGGLQDYKHTVWRYNLIHSEIGAHPKAGIYLDASSDNATLHHNILYNVHLSINGEVNQDSVYHNTLVSNIPKQKVTSHYQRYPDWDYRSVYVLNNLATNKLKGTQMQGNLIIGNIDSIGFAGYEYGDFRLIRNSPAVDAGESISSLNTPFGGKAPDVGAYEYGYEGQNEDWISGITWSPSWNQLPDANITIEPLGNLSHQFLVIDDIDDGWIMRYDWDFGDGHRSYGKKVHHQYQESGEYSVILTLRDNLAGIRRIEKVITVD